MPAVIKNHISFATKQAEAEALFPPGMITTKEASVEANVTAERIRQLVRDRGIGHWVERLRCYAVDRAKLEDHLARKRRKRGGISGAPK
jgi:hypothetical protein